jgi:hypothetical protein
LGVARERRLAIAAGITLALLLGESRGRMLGYLPSRPFPAYVALARRVGPLFFANDRHFTALGHCLAAVLIARWLDPTTAADAAACPVGSNRA